MQTALRCLAVPVAVFGLLYVTSCRTRGPSVPAAEAVTEVEAVKGAPAAAPVADAATVLLWHCDEGQGEQVADASTNNHTGKATGVTWVDGRFGKALHWEEGDGNLSTPGPFPQMKDAFTLQCWVKLDKLPTGQVPFWTADTVGQLGAASITIRPPGVMYVGVQLGEQPNHLTGQTKIPVGEWTHVALVYDGPYRKIGLFVNGKLDTEFDVAPGSPVNVNPSLNPFWVRSYGGTDEKLVGAIDEISLSNRAETFGYRWHSNLYLHLLRYQSAFLLGCSQAVAEPDPVTDYLLTVSDAGGKSVIKCTLAAKAVTEGALVPAKRLAQGEYAAKVTARRKSGKSEVMIERRFHFTPPGNLMSLTPENVCLVQGTPFFPLGAYHVRQEDLQTVRDGGFNMVFAFTTTYPPAWPQPSDGVGYIEKCAASGLLGVGLGGISDDTLKYYRDNPNLLMWYVADEPGGPGEGPETMQAQYEKWAAVDPNHPYFLLQNKPGEFLRYGHPCDIYATDPYPIHRQPQASLAQVARFTEGAVAAVFDRKPVWVALQCYTVKAVSDAGKHSDGTPRLPTLAELRCMSYLALASGARGLLYYAFDDSYYNNGSIRGVNLGKEFPEFWNQMTGLIRELGARQQVWTAPYAALRPVALSPDIIVQRRPLTTGGKTYVLVVNPKYEPRAVRVSLPGCRWEGQVSDDLGGSAGQVSKGELTDTLGPLQAKCYVLKM